MNWWKHLVEKADQAHSELRRSGEKKASTLMCGAIAVVGPSGARTDFEATSNYKGNDHHVEIDLLRQLFNWTLRERHAAYNLPPGCTVYLYVHNSPCKSCADKLSFQVNKVWKPSFENRTVTWALGFSEFYLGEDEVNKGGRFTSPPQANSYYKDKLDQWNWKKIGPSSSTAAADRVVRLAPAGLPQPPPQQLPPDPGPAAAAAAAAAVVAAVAAVPGPPVPVAAVRRGPPAPPVPASSHPGLGPAAAAAAAAAVAAAAANQGKRGAGAPPGPGTAQKRARREARPGGPPGPFDLAG